MSLNEKWWDLARMESIGYRLLEKGVLIDRDDIIDEAWSEFVRGERDASTGVKAYSSLTEYTYRKSLPLEAKAYFSACYMTGYIHGFAEKRAGTGRNELTTSEQNMFKLFEMNQFA